MANPKKIIKAVGRAVGGITGKGAKNVNPIYKNMNEKARTDAIAKRSVRVKPLTDQQREKQIQAEFNKDIKDFYQQQSEQMWEHMSSGENFSKVKKINSKRGN